MPTPEATDYQTEGLDTSINTIITETKAGYKTTEFWVAVVVSVLTAVEAYPVPDNAKAIIIGAIAAVYALSRGLAKQGVAAEETVTVAKP